jgi:ribosomal RNA-processing protein 1
MSEQKTHNPNLLKKLSSNDVKTRDIAVKALKRWIKRRKDVSEHDLQKVWKGIFYCFYMSDKVPIQQELAERLSAIHGELDYNRAYLYHKCFIHIMLIEWTQLDLYRMDKYMSLVRKMFKYYIKMIADNKFNYKIIDEFIRLYIKGPFALNDVTINARGLGLHLIDCYWNEIYNIINEYNYNFNNNNLNIFKRILTPFFILISTNTEKSVQQRIKKEIILPIINICNQSLIYENIILSGGSTLFSGFGDRLLSETKKLASKDLKIRIFAPQERIISSWIGGSILSSLASFQPMWITRKEWSEYGPTIVLRKCF